ncbi:MAG: BON domain-containing protein [Desulfuromonadaceae bacterium]|nr:BON domain-containing protein [Desulfuromonadaceae bacterium]
MVKFKRMLQMITCLFVVGSFIGCASMSTKTDTVEYIEDTVITAKVQAAILAEPELSDQQINVKTVDGVVQLTGYIDYTVYGKNAKEIAQAVDGVVSVENNLIVR